MKKCRYAACRHKLLILFGVHQPAKWHIKTIRLDKSRLQLGRQPSGVAQYQGAAAGGGLLPHRAFGGQGEQCGLHGEAEDEPDLSVSSPNPATLTFTPTNWNTAQTVTISAAQDTDAANGTARFTHTASSTSSSTTVSPSPTSRPPRSTTTICRPPPTCGPRRATVR